MIFEMNDFKIEIEVQDWGGFRHLVSIDELSEEGKKGLKDVFNNLIEKIDKDSSEE